MSMAVYNIIRVLISASRLKIKLHVILQKNTFQQQKHLLKLEVKFENRVLQFSYNITTRLEHKYGMKFRKFLLEISLLQISL